MEKTKREPKQAYRLVIRIVLFALILMLSCILFFIVLVSSGCTWDTEMVPSIPTPPDSNLVSSNIKKGRQSKFVGEGEWLYTINNYSPEDVMEFYKDASDIECWVQIHICRIPIENIGEYTISILSTDDQSSTTEYRISASWRICTFEWPDD